MSFFYPIAIIANFFAMTFFYIILGLIGKSNLAADFCIVQGATLALFFSFSANARSIILNPSSNKSVRPILLSRLLLSLPLGGIAFYLSVNLAHVDSFLAFSLVTRRCVEWISEVHLSEMEFRGHRKLPIIFSAFQFALFFLALIWLLNKFSFPWLGGLLWAVLPLFMSMGFIYKHLKDKSPLNMPWNLMLPNFGSTAVTGITVYVFRLLILLIVGKAIAGDLFTAFALGSFMGSIFANAIGPTIAHHENQIGGIVSWSSRPWSAFPSFFAGVSFFLASEFELNILSLSGKSFFFWGAAGLSMIGGAIMVLAQRIRIDILQHYDDKDVFGPDLVINLLILFFVPFTYYLIGMEALKVLFLFNSITAYLFYLSAKRGISTNGKERLSGTSGKVVKTTIAIILIFPLFFQLGGNIFNDPTHVFHSTGVLTRLPIPISIFACFGGLILIGDYMRSKTTLSVIFLTFVLMLWATIISTIGQVSDEKSKIILMLQFILPMFSLALGQMYENEKSLSSYFEKVIILILFLVIPCQIYSTWHMGRPLLSPYLYLFSIYQHIQYVTVIFVCLYLTALYSLWGEKNYKKLFVFLGPFMGFYAVSSFSMLTNFILLFGLLLFAIIWWYKKSDKLAAFLFLLVVIAFSIRFNILKSDRIFILQGGYKIENKYNFLSNNEIRNLNYRIKCWKYYISGINADTKILFFGHAQKPNREEYPSAHNYYLDLIYNFGVLSVIPILAMLVITIKKIYHLRKKIALDSNMVGLVLATMFLVLIDNSFKVGLRQPYPGIITFFFY